MTKNTYKSNTFKKVNRDKKKTSSGTSFKLFSDKRLQLSIGFLLIIVSVFMFTSFLSYLFTGKADQSVVASVSEIGLFRSGLEADNWLGVYGAVLSHTFIFQWFGISSFLIPPFLLALGYRIVVKRSIIPLGPFAVFAVFFLLWTSLLLGYLLLASEGVSIWGFLCGGVGFELATFFESLIGWGTLLLLAFTLIVFIIYFFNVTHLFGLVKKKNVDDGPFPAEDPKIKELGDEGLLPGEDYVNATITENENLIDLSDTLEDVNPKIATPNIDLDIRNEPTSEITDQEEKEEGREKDSGTGLEFHVETKTTIEETGTNVEHYDPKLDLGRYLYPTLDLLNEYDTANIQVTKEELEGNKDKIVETLINFKIGIASIKATIGPTVTLYEIVPDAGVKISKIKNLEDDIALSLAALGIRIIAPIPGRGTIGIEVPNKKREMVGIRSILSTEKFLKCEYELPIVLGKTISNEVYITDLTKMPHLLMAGATGQGKSVGLNVILTSLLYKKHPSQLKFILVDPKKVELSLYNKIERHFLAELPGADEVIITNTKQVVNTLNSLTIEMDNRYNLMKDAGARNMKEYNKKFVERRLNPEKGHRFLPYIVLVIDELADLMMTAGKEIEAPVARLAQLARAIGIHLVVATQRPSVNVITGIIKANFPTRMSFRVTSVVDSRTILDTGGANQLVGMGDMLLSQGSDIIRLQSPFVDTDEIERVCDFIGEQQGYDSAYLLPEYIDESGEGAKLVDLDDKDALFEEAARLIVLHQQGSTSLVQRKLKLGYNRAGRLIDQLEAAGIVGPFEGSKAREVLVQDEYALEQLLNDLNGVNN